MGISDYLSQGKDAIVAAGGMINDGVRGPSRSFTSGALTTVGTLGFLKKSYDLINHTGQALGVVNAGVDETGKQKEAAGLVTIGTDALLLALSGLAIYKGGQMGGRAPTP
jgi:hypothetical protein